MILMYFVGFFGLFFFYLKFYDSW